MNSATAALCAPRARQWTCASRPRCWPRSAEERDTPTTLGLAAAGAVRVMLSTGAFDLAQAELDSVTVPTTTRR